MPAYTRCMPGCFICAENQPYLPIRSSTSPPRSLSPSSTPSSPTTPLSDTSWFSTRSHLNTMEAGLQTLQTTRMDLVSHLSHPAAVIAWCNERAADLRHGREPKGVLIATRPGSSTPSAWDRARLRNLHFESLAQLAAAKKVDAEQHDSDIVEQARSAVTMANAWILGKWSEGLIHALQRGEKMKGVLLDTAPGAEKAEVWDLWKLGIRKSDAVRERAGMEEQIETLGAECEILRKEIACVERKLRAR